MKLRPSLYNIIMPTVNEKEYVAVHGYTKAFDIIDNKLAQILMKNNWIEADSIGRDIAFKLLKRGYLVPEKADEESNKFKTFVTKLHQAKRERAIPGFTLMPTYMCNLNCFYCYQKPFVDSDLKKNSMSIKMANKAFDAIKRLLKDHPDKKSGITLYGGEPLIKGNKDLIKHIVQKARIECGLKVSAISNGVHLNHFVDLLGKDGIEWMQITLDGPKSVHDERRVHHNGDGSFDRIIKNINLALKTDIQISIRVNVDKQNLNQLAELEQVYIDNNWKNNRQISIHVSEVHTVSEQDSFLDEQKLLSASELIDYIENNTTCIGNRKEIIEKQILGILGNNSTGDFKTGFCGANYKSYVFDPFGKIYPCWDDVGTDKEIGDYSTGEAVFYNDKADFWHTTRASTDSKCSKCPYFLYCGGGCFSQVSNNGDSHDQKYCKDFINIFNSIFSEGISVMQESFKQNVIKKEKHENKYSIQNNKEYVQIKKNIRSKLNLKTNSNNTVFLN